MEHFKKLVQSDGFKKALFIILGVVALLFVFQLGMFFGFQKALFSDRVGGDYFRLMNGDRNDFFMGFRIGDFLNSHGAIGKIVGIKLPVIVVEDNDGDNKSVQIASSTQIKYMNTAEQAGDLKLGDFIVVFGAPTDDAPVINAQLIRVLPPASSLMNNGSMMAGTSTN
jgi:hypothetical protein